MNSIRNYLFLPVAAAMAGGAVLVETHWLSVGLFLVFWCCICCKKSLKLFLAGVFCSFFVMLSTSYWLAPIDTLPLGSQRLPLVVEAASIKINGDGLSFYATAEHSRVHCRYRLQSQQEQHWWQQLDKSILLVAEGETLEPEGSRNLHGFDYQRHLLTERCQRLFHIESYQMGETTASSPLQKISELRRHAIIHTKHRFSAKLASYINALLFGYRDAVFNETADVFSPLGLLHLFSLSGMHAQFFFGICYWLLRRSDLLVHQSFFLLLLLVTIGCGLAGLGVSVLRASIAFLLRLLCRWFQLHVSPLDSWSMTCFFVLLIRPLACFSIGGQLSLLISLLLVFTSDCLSGKQPKLKSLLHAVLLSVCMLPMIAYHFYQWSLLTGLLTWVFIPLFLYLYLPVCLSLFLLSLLPLSVDFLQSWFEAFLLAVEIIVPVANSTVITTGTIPLAVLAAATLGALKGCQMMRHAKWGKGLLYCMVALFPLVYKYTVPVHMLAFIDVGQGDSILFHGAFHGEAILIDTGGQLAFSKEDWQEGQHRSHAEMQLLPFLRSQGIDRLDRVVATHADTDHIGNLHELSQQILIDELIFGWGMMETEKAGRLLKELAEGGIRVTEVKAGMNIIGSDFAFAVLHPSEKGSGENEDSIVLYTKIGDANILLTGDGDHAVEEALMARYPQLRATILKAGHHGSRTSSSLRFLNHIQVDTTIISTGKNNRYGHPHKEVLEALESVKSDVLRTDESGMIYYTWLSENQLFRADTVIKKSD